MAFTYFFRDLQTLHLIRDQVVPSLRTSRYIHIWDAGCAHGPEPYTLAIILREGGFLAMEQTQELPKEVKGLFEQVVSHARIYRKIG